MRHTMHPPAWEFHSHAALHHADDKSDAISSTVALGRGAGEVLAEIALDLSIT